MNEQRLKLLEQLGYIYNQPYDFWYSTNNTLPDVDIDGFTIYYKFGPEENEYYKGGILIEDYIMDLSTRKKNQNP